MSFVVAELHINKRADGATTSIKAKPNVRNISTQHLTTLLDRVEGCCEEAGQTRATSCNIENVVTLQKLDPTPSNILHIFQQGGQTCQTCVMWLSIKPKKIGGGASVHPRLSQVI